MSIYKEYLTGEARDIAIQEATLENEFIKLDTMFEMTVLQLDQMYRDAELKVLTESGTYGDLMYLYEQADAEVKPQQGNILQKIVDAVMSILNSIGNTIKGIFSTGNPEDEVELPQETVKCAKESLNLFGKIKQGVEKIKSGHIMDGLKDLGKVAIPALAIGAAVGGTIAVVRMKKRDADAFAQKLGEMKDYFTNSIAKIKQFFSGIFNKVSGVFNKNKPKQLPDNGGNNNANNNTNTNTKESEDEGLFKKVIDKLREYAGGIKKIIDSISTSVKKAFPNAKKKADDLINKGKKVVNDVNEVKDTAENMVGDAKNVVNGGNQFETVSAGMGRTWKVDKSTGKIRLVDRKGRDVKIGKKTRIPDNVVDIANKIKNGGQQTNESFIDELNANTDGKYIVEMAEDTIDVRELVEVKMESTSIFGYDIANELVFQESDAFDAELSELVELFDSL